MNIAFFVGEMNLRGVANSTYQYAIHNRLILKNKSIIFYDRSNHRNNIQVIKKFKKKFIVIGVKNLEEIDNYKFKLGLDYLYIQKSGQKDKWQSNNIKTIVHSVYPQKLKEVHGDKYAFISEWISNEFSNNKIPYVPYIVKLEKNKDNLKHKLKIKKDQTVFGCHGGHSSFDLKFAQDTLIDIVKKRKNLTFLFLNIEKFFDHPRIVFLKGSSDENYKKKFLNSCDAMLHGRSLGESFGLSCAEFAHLKKPIISYKFNRHRSHLYHLTNKNYLEYSNRGNLFYILSNFDRNKRKKNKKSKYSNYDAKLVMKKFKESFLDKPKTKQILFNDYLVNQLAYLKMGYFYVRHKIYNHYYKFIASKLIY